MRLAILTAIISLCASAKAHVPVLLLPLEGAPISSYYLGRSEISRAVFSELAGEEELLVLQFSVSAGNAKTLLQLFTPVCQGLPEYETFQPRAVLLEGEVPWRNQGESHRDYLARLQARARAKLSSSYAVGKRPTYYEEHGKRTYWVGGEWRGELKPGLYSLVVHDPGGRQGTFTLGLNEKEDWTPDLFRYSDSVVKKVADGICAPKGFSGRVSPKK